MRLLIIRGDLQSHSGYSAAARDYCRQLRGLFDRIVGVDIHYSALRPYEQFPYPLVTDTEAQEFAASADFTLVLSFTTPDHYARYPHSVNVGLTFWETDRLPLQGRDFSPWTDQANAMDALWLPSSHTKHVFEKAGVTVPIRVIPWPIEIPQHVAKGLPEGEVFKLDRCSQPVGWLATLASFKEDRFRWSRRLTEAISRPMQKLYLRRLRISSQKLAQGLDRTFVCVAQHVPRKALLLFLSEWMEFKRHAESKLWRLILKTSPIDPGISNFEFVSEFWEHVRALKKQLSVSKTEVYLWDGDLAGPEFHRLIANACALVAPSLGEGFCGPAALALGLGKPLIAPRHTSIADYLADDYRYSFESRPVHVSFVDDPLRVYDPASRWHIPLPFALSKALRRLCTDPPEKQNEVCWRACAYFSNRCSPQRVQRMLADAVQDLMAQSSRRAVA